MITASKRWMNWPTILMAFAVEISFAEALLQRMEPERRNTSFNE